MRHLATTSLIAVLAIAPLAAQAEGFSYSYLEGGYVETDFDEFDEDADGWALGGSFEITPEVFMFAGYGDLSAGPVDLETYDVGGGYAFSISPQADLYGTISYVKAEADGFGFSADDDGYGLGVGIRYRVADPFELEAGINYVDLSDSGDDTSFGIAGRWYFVEDLALGLGIDFSDDAETYGISLRWEFGE
jgi:long-subunit fatty acid transport protein